MKISRKAKTGCAAVLAALMAVTGLSMQQTYAAKAVDLERKDCSIKISVSIGRNGDKHGNDEYLEDFNAMSIPADLYRVASVDVTGQNYETYAPFNSVDLSGINSETKASEWLDMAKTAAAKENLEAAKEASNEGEQLYWNETIQSGTATFTGLAPGMYLVVPETTFNLDYTVKYSFTPYLTALPSSAYTTGYDEDGNAMQTGSDEWIYNTEIGLKPEAEPLFGRLEITKELENFNETLGQTTFTFLVEGRDPETGELLYSDVVSTTHEELASETVTLEHIPAGITVTVTEIYTGASYEAVGDIAKDVLIWSDEAVGKEVDGVTIETPAVTFQNRYNGGNRGGYGVNNQFERENGVWEWKSGPEF